METTIILSPFSGFPQAEEYLGELARYVLARGDVPFAAHAVFPRWLDDNDSQQRNLGMLCGYHMYSELLPCKVLAGIRHGISPGMLEELEWFKNYECTVEYLP